MTVEDLSARTTSSSELVTMRSSVELFESLRRISLSVGSNLELDTVLQTIVDAVCDHSQWQVCWINEVHVSHNYAEVVARRDKLEYTLESRRRKWDLHRIPTLEALRRNEPIAIPNIALCEDYPDYCEDALARGAVAGVIIPFNTADPLDLPRVMCVQSTLPLLSDDRQLPFLRTVTGMASLAVHNARQTDSKRRETLQSTESVSLFSFATESLAQGMETIELCAQLEQRTDSALILFDCDGAIDVVGRSPVRYELSDSEWEALVRSRGEELARLVRERCSQESPTATVQLEGILPLAETMLATISRLPGSPSLGAVIAINREGTGPHIQASLTPAIAATVLRDQIRFDVERELNADALSTLFLPGPVVDPTITRRAASFGIDITQPQALVLIRPTGARLSRGTARLRLGVAAVLQRWPGATVHSINSDLVVFLGDADNEEVLQARIRTLHGQLTQATGPTSLFMTWAGPCVARADYPQAWNECLTTMDLAQKLGRHDPVNLKEFGSYRFLISALAEQDIGGYIQQILGPLLEHDEQHSSELLETVEAFLHCGGRLQETSRRLHIHVSTLRYRIDRIKALIAKDISDDDTRFELSLAVRLYRLRLLQGPQA
jgi:hypothetical protein